MPEIVTADISRIRHVSHFANRLFGELETLFAAVSARIARIAGHLDTLEESAAAAEVRAMLDCDQVLVLEHGAVRQIGTPAALLQQEGPFREIYQMQMAIGEEEPA